MATDHGRLEQFVVWLPAEGRQTECPAADNGRAFKLSPAFEQELYNPPVSIGMIDG